MFAHARSGFILGTLLVLLLPFGALGMPTAAHAAAPQHINFSYTDPNAQRCGVSGTLTGSGVDNAWPVFDAYGNLIAIKDLHEETRTFTATNGQSITIHMANQWVGNITVNPDGSFTIVNTYRGLPEQLKLPGGPVLIQDAGLVTFVTRFDSAGNFVSSTIAVDNGPHPLAENGDCQAILSALS